MLLTCSQQVLLQFCIHAYVLTAVEPQHLLYLEHSCELKLCLEEQALNQGREKNFLQVYVFFSCRDPDKLLLGKFIVENSFHSG